VSAILENPEPEKVRKANRTPRSRFLPKKESSKAKPKANTETAPKVSRLQEVISRRTSSPPAAIFRKDPKILPTRESAPTKQKENTPSPENLGIPEEFFLYRFSRKLFEKGNEYLIARISPERQQAWRNSSFLKLISRGKKYLIDQFSPLPDQEQTGILRTRGFERLCFLILLVAFSAIFYAFGIRNGEVKQIARRPSSSFTAK